MNPWWYFLKEPASVSCYLCSAPSKTAAMLWGSCTPCSIPYSRFPTAGAQRKSLLSSHLSFFSWEIRANGGIGNIHVSSHCAVRIQRRDTSGYQNHRGNTAHSIDTAVIVIDAGSNINVF